MRVLVACEESQRVCIAFREKGHEAYSCDLKPSSGGFPEWHIQDDVLSVLNDSWDLVIAHPPCTYLTVTGNRWFDVSKYGDKAVARAQSREDAVSFFMSFVNCSCGKVAIENPVGVMSTRYRKPDQIIHPYFFGDAFEKRTCLWLKGLPCLVPSNVVEPPERVLCANGKTMPKWYADLWALSPDERSRVRSVTFPGFAYAMAEQWG